MGTSSSLDTLGPVLRLNHAVDPLGLNLCLGRADAREVNGATLPSAHDFNFGFPERFHNVSHHPGRNDYAVAGALSVNNVDFAPLAVP